MKTNEWNLLLLILMVSLTSLIICPEVAFADEQGTFSTRIDFVIVDLDSNKVISPVDSDEMNIVDLEGSQIFAPRLIVSNQASSEITVEVKAHINGKDAAWKPDIRKAGSEKGYIPTNFYNGAGVYFYSFSVNGCTAQYGIFEVKEPTSVPDIIRMGNKYYLGKETEKNYDKALEWYLRAADQSSGAQLLAGRCYEELAEYEKALEWYRKAAENGDDDAQNALGICYKQGKGVPQDMNEAIKWYKMAADQGNINAQYNLGLLYDNQKEYEKAIEWYNKAAEQGSLDAQNNLGLLYYNQKEPEKAIEWYTKAAEQGNAMAQYNLGCCYCDNGEYEKAVEWFEKAADQGYVAAQNSLGVRYDRGEGVEKNPQKAEEWYKKAAEQGSVAAQYNLGLLYDNQKEYEKAIEWYTKAANNGNEKALFRIGKIYEKQESLDQAAQWYKKAIDSGVSEAEEAYDRVISLIAEEAAQEKIMDDIMNEILNDLS